MIEIVIRPSFAVRLAPCGADLSQNFRLALSRRTHAAGNGHQMHERGIVFVMRGSDRGVRLSHMRHDLKCHIALRSMPPPIDFQPMTGREHHGWHAVCVKPPRDLAGAHRIDGHGSGASA